MLDSRQRRALIVEAHHFVRGTKEQFIASLSGDRGIQDTLCMPDRALTDSESSALRHLSLEQVAALDKLAEGALGVMLFEYLQLLDGVVQPHGMGEWQGIELSPALSQPKVFLHDDFYPVYRDMRRYEAGDHSSDVRDGEPPKTKLS